MVLFATLRRSGGIEAIARHLAIPPAFAQTIIPIAIGPVVEQFARRYAAAGRGRAGIDAVLSLVDGFGGGELAVEVLAPAAVDLAKGEALLSAFYGTAESMHSAIQTTAQASGIDEALLARVFPLLTMLIGGYLAARGGDWANPDLASAESTANIAEFERLLIHETATLRPAKFKDHD